MSNIKRAKITEVRTKIFYMLEQDRYMVSRGMGPIFL